MARLQRTSRGTIILPNKERITLSEQKRLINAVRRANRMRTKDIERLQRLNAKTKFNRFGVESDFLLRKKSASFSRFRNKKEFKSYLWRTEKQASGSTSMRRINTYINNYITALRKVFNSQADKAIAMLRKIDKLRLRDAFDSGELEPIGYIYYDPDGSKLLVIEQQLEQLLKQ